MCRKKHQVLLSTTPEYDLFIDSRCRYETINAAFTHKHICAVLQCALRTFAGLNSLWAVSDFITCMRPQVYTDTTQQADQRGLMNQNRVPGNPRNRITPIHIDVVAAPKGSYFALG